MTKDNQPSLEDYMSSSEPESQDRASPTTRAEKHSPAQSETTSATGRSAKSRATIVDREDSLEEEGIVDEEESVGEYVIGERDVPQNLPPSFLLSIDYDGQKAKAIARLYRPETKELFFWFDDTGHKPYCLTDFPPQVAQQKAGRHPGFSQTEEVELRDLLRDKEVTMTKILAEDPLSIGGRQGSIRELLTERVSTGDPSNPYEEVSHAWEANIRYRNTYTYDREIVAGLMYKVEDGHLVPCPPKLDKETLDEFKETLDPDEGLDRIISTYAPMFFTEVPDVKRLALDIEVYTPVKNRIPDASTAPYPVTAVGLSDNEGFNKCFVLERKGQEMGEKTSGYPEELELVFYTDEREMILEVFKLVDQYPIVLTFVGDAFDLNYLYHRAKKIGIDVQTQCPIYLGREVALLKRGIHVDLYRFLKNPSVRIYALSGAYERNNLESIAQGILGIGKLELNTEISDLPYYELAHYCWLDANITLRITTFKNNLLFRLIVLLMRISRLSMEDVTRQGISSWIQSLFRQEHRSRKALIPKRDDIESMKPSEAHTEAMIKDKSFKGAIVIEPVAGVHFNATVLDFASLYPTIMKRHNISYETVDCPHESCRNATDNRVPETDHWTCKKRTGMISETIGFFRDTRVRWFKRKSKDGSLDERTRDWYSVVEKALKVFVNACLPFDEAVIVRDSHGLISRRAIGSLEHEWSDLEILSIDNNWGSSPFGKPIFVPIVGFRKSGSARLLDICLRDGRTIRCTDNHVFPRLLPKHKRKHRKVISKKPLSIEYVAAEDLRVNDDILMAERLPLTAHPPETLFVPDLIPQESIHVGVKRSDYTKFSYRRSQRNDNPLISLINKEFRYSKASKWYRARWCDLSDEARELIRRNETDTLPFYIKLIERSGRWREAGQWENIRIELDEDFFAFMGWYLSEGHVGVNRVSISQYQEVNPVYFNEIGSLLQRMDLPFAVYSKKDHVIHSKTLAAIMEHLCGSYSKSKSIPLRLLDERRARVVLESFFKGDGNINVRGNRRYTTSSKQLAHDILYLLGALGRHASVHRDESIYRVVETKGLKYQRTGRGLIDFNGTRTVRIRSIERRADPEQTYDLETGNGLFVSTNGIVVHNSYGVTGAQHFELFCMPAAESVTAYGRHAIIRTKEKAESMGVRVLYGDTDSVFLDNPTSEQQAELVKWSQDELGIDLEVEKTYKYVALSDRKKNYIGVYDSGYVEVKGLSGKKRNTPDFVQDAFREMLDVLSRVDNREGFKAAKDEIREIVNVVLDRLEGKTEPYSPEDLAFRVQMTKEIAQYGKTTPQHVRAAIQLRDAGYEVPSGTIVEYIKTKGPEGVLPVELAEEGTYFIDKDKYIDTLRSVFGQVLDSVGIDFEELMGFTTLDQFF